MWPVIRHAGALTVPPHRRYVPDAPAKPAAPYLYPGEPAACLRSPRDFLAVMAHLGLFLAIFARYRVEGPVFRGLAAIALLALPVHYALPYRWKKPFFVGVSVVGLAYVVGAPTALIVLAISALLIGICYLPVAWGVRAGLVAAVALACGLARNTAALPGNVWPMVGTIFMFRMIIYLYELKHAKTREPLGDTLSYFFLLPNFCFPLFPVVDYRTLQRGYFARDVHQTQRAGLRLMFKGTVHLLLYRLVYHELLTKPEDVADPAGLAAFLVCNYLRYLHVSGQFHVACGMLHLFGFQLPETHRDYLLATGFTDYWRRINIYWKDFMVRVAFNPVVFRLKRWPRPASLGLATVVVFVATWFLHAYQSFWLRGEWGFSPQDGLFWGILGALVLVNLQFDLRRAPASRARRERAGVAALALRAAKTAGTFATITVLWSLWTSQSVGAWASMVRRGLGV